MCRLFFFKLFPPFYNCLVFCQRNFLFDTKTYCFWVMNESTNGTTGLNTKKHIFASLWYSRYRLTQYQRQKRKHFVFSAKVVYFVLTADDEFFVRLKKKQHFVFAKIFNTFPFLSAFGSVNLRSFFFLVDSLYRSIRIFYLQVLHEC